MGRLKRPRNRITSFRAFFVSVLATNSPTLLAQPSISFSSFCYLTSGDLPAPQFNRVQNIRRNRNECIERTSKDSFVEIFVETFDKIDNIWNRSNRIYYYYILFHFNREYNESRCSANRFNPILWFCNFNTFLIYRSMFGLDDLTYISFLQNRKRRILKISRF